MGLTKEIYQALESIVGPEHISDDPAICEADTKGGAMEFIADRGAVRPACVILPGNTNGPQAADYGAGGWTWYTGSGTWLYRVSTNWILGVRPTYDGLLIDPCVPKIWDGFSMKRIYRKAY